MRRLPKKPAARRGVTVILVLGLLSITLALSYAMLRTQTTTAQIQNNQDWREEARRASHTALMVALRRMHEADWAGVDVPLTGSLDANIFYAVTFKTGDGRLSPGDPDYEKWPYRVTLSSVAWVVDQANARVGSAHRSQAVVELVPRALSPQPAGWSDLQNHTVYQWSDAAVVCQTPVRIEGPAHLQGPIALCEAYPPLSRPWDGEIDELTVFGKALSQLEIQQIVTAGSTSSLLLSTEYLLHDPIHWWRLNDAEGATTAIDSAGDATGTLKNGTVAGVAGFPTLEGTNSAARFDGRNDYISVGNLDVAGDAMTIVAWFKADSWDGSTDARIISKATGTTTDNHFWMLSTTQHEGQMRLRFRIRSNGWTKTLYASSGDLQTGQWYCGAAVYDGVDMVLYLNGVEVGRTAKTGDLNTDSTVPVYIGENPPGSPQARYLRDLEAMRVAGLGDRRPFSGPIDMPTSRTDKSTQALLADELNITLNDVAATNSAPLSHPGLVTAYRLYPGGKLYSVTTLSVENITGPLTPDMETNPLGLFVREGRLQLGQDVAVEGTLITTGGQPDLQIAGDNVRISPVQLPSLYGTTEPIELPAAIVEDDVLVGPHSGTGIRGLVAAWDEFRWEEGDSSASCDFTGRLLSGQLQLRGRTDWDAIANGTWESWLTQFVNQQDGGEPHFPQWLDGHAGLSPEPLLTIRPASAAVAYHWQDWSQPVFAAHPDDEGLVWDIVRWTDNPQP